MEKNDNKIIFVTFKEFLIRRNFSQLITIDKKPTKNKGKK
jgi:hypothetical protein